MPCLTHRDRLVSRASWLTVAVVSSQSSSRKRVEWAGFTSSFVQFTSFNDAKIFKRSEKLSPQKSLVHKSRVSKCIIHGSWKHRKPVSRGRKNIDSRITEKVNPHSRFTQSKKCLFTRHGKSIGDPLLDTKRKVLYEIYLTWTPPGKLITAKTVNSTDIFPNYQPPHQVVFHWV